jgi:opacity protein-like surface antigen
MKRKLLVAALLTVVGTGAIAQSAFEGFYGQVGIGYESVTPSFTGGSVSGYNYSASGNNSNSFAGTVGIGFNVAVTPTFLLGLGAEYSPIAGDKANYTLTVPGVGSGTSQYNKKNSYNIFVSPSIAIDKDKLAYAKVGYTGATVDYSCSGCSSDNLTGYSLGLGYKQIISGGLYGFGEVNYSKYGNVNVGGGATGSFSASATNVLAGLGYKF